MYKNKKAFTLSEVLVTLTIIGIVAALTIPSIVSKMPNKEAMSYRKSFAVAQQFVSDIVNDSEFFPTDDVDLSIAPHSENFCTYALKYINIMGEDQCKSCEGDNACFTTTDGVQWYDMRLSFKDDGNAIIRVKAPDFDDFHSIVISQNGKVYLTPEFPTEINWLTDPHKSVMRGE